MVQENVIEEKTEMARHGGVKKFFAWFAGIAGVLFLVIVVVGFLPGRWEPYFMAELAIKDRLKSPDSAEFPDAFEYKNAVIMTPITNGYRVVSWVKAKNIFGVTLKRPWSCDVGHKAGIEGWYVIGTCGILE